MLFEILLDFKRGHAPGACSGNGLAIAAVLHVAAGEDPGDTGEDLLVRPDVAVGVEINLPLKRFRAR